jgi:hypothetical protein
MAHEFSGRTFWKGPLGALSVPRSELCIVLRILDEGIYARKLDTAILFHITKLFN